MLKMTKRALLVAAASLPLMTSAAWAEGLISIIVTDPANPYWFTEGEVAKKTAEELGYTATVAAHKGDTNVESNLIDAAITNSAKAIILDPANADGSVGVVRKATEAGIPVFLVNAEINESGIAIGQLVSNNAQEKVAEEVANWDRTQGYNKMQSIIQANPEIDAVISGNDEMALGAIAALKEAGKLEGVTVGGFDGSPDAVEAIKAGEMAFTVLQPGAVFSREAVIQADHYIKNGEPMVAEEKQLFDCLLITPDNVANYTAPFTLSE